MEKKKEIEILETKQAINDIKATILFEGENYRCKYSGQTAAQQLEIYKRKLDVLMA